MAGKRDGLSLNGRYEVTLEGGIRGTIEGRFRIKIDPKKLRIRPINKKRLTKTRRAS